MAVSAYFLGIDVSAGGLGLIVIGGDGTVLAHLRRAYGGEDTGPMDPQDWWRAARTGIKEILRRAELRPDQVRAIGISGDADGVVAIDREGKVLSPAVFGPDPAVAPYVDQLTQKVGARNLLNLASGPAHAGATAVKLLWLRETHKRVWHDCAHLLSPKDFLRYRLTGTAVTDACDAAASLLFNPRTRSWSKQLLQLLDLNPAWLPAINNGNSISGRVIESAAREAGLQAGTPVVTGASHAAAIAVTAGVLQPGTAAIELGHQGSVFLPTAEAARDPSGRLLSTCHCIAGTWALVSQGAAGADALDWLMFHVMPSEVAQARRAQRDPLDVMAELAAEVPPGADGLIHLPAAAKTSGFLGLSSRHGRGHLVRAVLEGGAIACQRILAGLADSKIPAPERVVLTGPGASNHLWCQIMADALDREVHAAGVPEVAAAGSAILAAATVGVHKTVEDAAAKMVKNRNSFASRRSAAVVYADLARESARLADAIAGTRTKAPEPATEMML